MDYIDLLQELGRARRALEDLIAATSGSGTRDLLSGRDAITSVINRVADERSRLEGVDVTAAASKLDDVAAELSGLAAGSKDIRKAVALAKTATATVAAVLDAIEPPPARAAARTLLAAPAAGGQLFTAFCNRHDVELPPTKVTLAHAMQNESDHLAIPGNENDDIDIILVR